MPNKNYLAGRRLEYEVKAHYERQGALVIRASGSHGAFDLVVIHKSGQVELVQCKGAKEQAALDLLKKKWRLDPPLGNKVHYQFLQTLATKVVRGKVEFTTV